MAKSFQLEVITPERLFFKGNVEMVIVRTLLGDEGFLANHTWACKLLDTGVLRIKETGSKVFKVAAITGGFVDVKDSVVIFTDAAEWPEEIDEKRALEAEQRAQERLAQERGGDDLGTMGHSKVALMRAMTRRKIKSMSSIGSK